MSNEAEFGAQIERLTLAAAGKTVEIGGRVYSTQEVHDPRRQEPEPKTISLSTLTALCAYALSHHDAGYRDSRKEFVHVEGPGSVRLCTDIFGEFNQRVEIAKATAQHPTFPFGTFLDPEAFNIALMVHFGPGDAVPDIQKIVGNLTTEAVQTVADDGVSQTVTAKAGLVRRDTIEIPRTVMLRPYRTFLEVEQPASPFILRLRGGGNDRLPTCALFEADGGAWRIKATANVHEFLVDALKGAIAVYS